MFDTAVLACPFDSDDIVRSRYKGKRCAICGDISHDYDDYDASIPAGMTECQRCEHCVVHLRCSSNGFCAHCADSPERLVHDLGHVAWQASVAIDDLYEAMKSEQNPISLGEIRVELDKMRTDIMNILDAWPKLIAALYTKPA